MSSAAQLVFATRHLRQLILLYRVNWTLKKALALARIDVLQVFGEQWTISPLSAWRVNWEMRTGHHLAVVQWLHANCPGMTFPINEAAETGHLEVIQWLHAHCTVLCTDDAMNWAAANGHLAVVQWLHANRTEGCTTSAMNFAAANGHLAVVQWLHANRTEECTQSAMSCARQYGHTLVAQWLHDNVDFYLE
jgi:hypothetical protein